VGKQGRNKESERFRETEIAEVAARGGDKDASAFKRAERERERENERFGRTNRVFVGQGWNFRAGTSLKIHAVRNAGRELELSLCRAGDASRRIASRRVVGEEKRGERTYLRTFGIFASRSGARCLSCQLAFVPARTAWISTIALHLVTTSAAAFIADVTLE